MENTQFQNKTADELLLQLKKYEEREKAFQIHLKIKDDEIMKLEKDIKKLRGDINQINTEDNDKENEGSIINEEVNQENAAKDNNIYIDPYYNEYLNELINIIKCKNKEHQDKNQKGEQIQTSDNNNNLNQIFQKCKDYVKENLELYNYFQSGILENLKFENGLEKNQIELLMIKLKTLERYKDEIEFESNEDNDKINEVLEKM